LSAKTIVFNAQTPFLRRLLYECIKLCDPIRFREIVICAELHRFDRCFNRRVTGK